MLTPSFWPINQLPKCRNIVNHITLFGTPAVRIRNSNENGENLQEILLKMTGLSQKVVTPCNFRVSRLKGITWSVVGALYMDRRLDWMIQRSLPSWRYNSSVFLFYLTLPQRLLMQKNSYQSLSVEPKMFFFVLISGSQYSFIFCDSSDTSLGISHSPQRDPFFFY